MQDLERSTSPAVSAPPETQQPKVSAKHVAALDGVRGLAVLAVMLYHASDYMPGKNPLIAGIRSAVSLGWSGVDLFFVLSGFLITGILLDTRGSPRYFSSFYARRALRIFPLYYLVLSTILFAAHFSRELRSIVPSPHDQAFYFFYLNNWWPLLHDTWHGNAIGHFWSLAVEEQFYLLWSLCIFLIPPKRIVGVAMGGIVAALLIRLGIYWHAGLIRDLTENTFARMDPLLMGALVAALVRRPELLKRWKRPLLLTGALAAMVVIALFYPNRNYTLVPTVGYSLLALAYGALVLYAFDSGDRSAAKRLLSDRRLTTVGKYSYGMYVYHVPVLSAVSHVARKFVYYESSVPLTLAFVVLVLVATFFIAKLSFDVFESRFLSLKRYFRA